MTLVVPFVGELRGEDARLMRLAEFLGVTCKTLALPPEVRHHGECLEDTVPDSNSCLVVNPRVMGYSSCGDKLTENLSARIRSCFKHVIVHGLRPTKLDASVVSALSLGRIESVQRMDEGRQYEIARTSTDICGAFAGLTFGPTIPDNDYVFSGNSHHSNVRELILIAGHPFLASIQLGSCHLVFLASQDVADIDAETANASLPSYFSRLLPHSMVLRHVFAQECWRPSGQYAAIIIDDPLLRHTYGFLNFESLHRLMKRHRFHTTIAFIPHNYRRNALGTTRLFHDNPDKFGLCYHGNDHTGAELASVNTAHLNTMLCKAEQRMKMHHEITGLECDRVMVFPQGQFSVEAMRVLKSRNFLAAVNTVPHPMGDTARLTIRDLAQPAVLRYGGFPLFLRKPIRETETHDIAFNVFFGKPVFIVEHHNVFQHPDSLAEVVDKINWVAPEIRWCRLATAVDRSTLVRWSLDGVRHVQAYATAVQVDNDMAIPNRFSIEWKQTQGPQVEHVLQGGAPLPADETEHSLIRVSADMPPNSSQKFAVIYQSQQAPRGGLGLRWTTKAFVRRRLSEIRDNHLAKSPRVLAVANAFCRQLQLRRGGETPPGPC